MYDAIYEVEIALCNINKDTLQLNATNKFSQYFNYTLIMRDFGGRENDAVDHDVVGGKSDLGRHHWVQVGDVNDEEQRPPHSALNYARLNFSGVRFCPNVHNKLTRSNAEVSH
jgi:hypothetical protein